MKITSDYKLVSTVSLNRDDFIELIETIQDLKQRVSNLEHVNKDILIDRAYARELTGWSESTLWRKDKKFGIFGGMRKIPLSKLHYDLDRILGQRYYTKNDRFERNQIT